MALSIENRQRRPEILYALEVLLGRRAADAATAGGPTDRPLVTIHYGAQPPPPLRPFLWIRESAFFGDDFGTPRSVPREPALRLEGLPFLYTAAGEPPALRRRAAAVETTADLVASAFFLLSGYEEAVVAARDEHGRLPASWSFLGRAGLCAVPLVDEYAAFLRRLLDELAGAPREGAPPTRRPFAIVLTHDVDGLRPPRDRGGERMGRPATDGREPSVVDAALEIEARRGVRSTFFFLAGGADPVRPRYRLEDRAARRALAAVRRSGGEIGLHGSYYCPDRPQALEAELEALRQAGGDPEGFRQHYLRLPVAALSRLERAGLRYDSSLGWADAVGFRNGTARPFRPFDFEGRRALRLLEIPLVAMDRTLEKYLGAGADAAWEKVLPVLDGVRRVGGCAAVLWHPEFFDDHRHPGYGALYERILDWVSDAGGCLLTGSEASGGWGGGWGA